MPIHFTHEIKGRLVKIHGLHCALAPKPFPPRYFNAVTHTDIVTSFLRKVQRTCGSIHSNFVDFHRHHDVARLLFEAGLCGEGLLFLLYINPGGPIDAHPFYGCFSALVCSMTDDSRIARQDRTRWFGNRHVNSFMLSIEGLNMVWYI